MRGSSLGSRLREKYSFAHFGLIGLERSPPTACAVGFIWRRLAANTHGTKKNEAASCRSRLFRGKGETVIPLPLCARVVVILRGVLGQFRQALAMTLGRGDDFHLLPVVGKLFTAIETSNVRSGQSCGLGAARCLANGNGKAVARMAATEKCIDKSCDHTSTFHTQELG